MNETLKTYYEYLRGAGADAPDTFESFSSTLSDEATAKQYFEYLKSGGFDAPDTFESFSSTLGIKKKVSSDAYLPTVENLQEDFQQRQQQSGEFSVAPSISETNPPTPVEARADKAYEAKGWPSPRKKMQDFEIGVANLKSDVINQRLSPEEAQLKVDELAQGIGIGKDEEGYSISSTEIEMYTEEKERAYQQSIKEKKEGEKEGFFKDVLDQLNIGSNRVMTSPIRAMAVSERIANGMIGLIDRKDKINSTYYQDMAASDASISDMWRESNMRYDGSIVELMQKGETGKAVGQTVMAIAENIPTLATIALGTVSGASNLTLGYVGFDKGADEYIRTTADTNMSEFSRWVNFATKALSEVVWENIGTVSIIKGVQKGIAEVGEQTMKQQLNSAFTPFLQKQMGLVNKGMSAVVREGGSEGATQLTDNLMDMALGRDVKLFDGFGDAVIVGGVIGAGIVSPQLIAEYKGGQSAFVKQIIREIPDNLDYEKKVEMAELLAESAQIKFDQKNGIAGTEDIKKQRLEEIKTRVAEIMNAPMAESTDTQAEEIKESPVTPIVLGEMTPATKSEKRILAIEGDAFTIPVTKDGADIGTATIENADDGWRIKWIGTEKGFGGRTMRILNERAMVEGKVLISDVEGKNSGPMIKAWDRLVESGEAEKIGEENYRFIRPETPQISPQIPPVSEVKTKSDTQVPLGANTPIRTQDVETPAMSSGEVVTPVEEKVAEIAPEEATLAETAQVQATPLKVEEENQAIPLNDVQEPEVSTLREQEVKVEQRDRVKQEILSVGAKVTPEQADAALTLFDAQAKVFADTLGKTTEDYYATIDVQGEAQASVQAREAQREGRTIKGQYQTIGGRDVVTLMKKGDVSTVLHEIAGHRGRRLLSELGAADKRWDGRLKEVEKWAGVKDGKWSAPADEKFARAFEGYVRNGKLPQSAPQALRSAFDKLVEWMKAIYADPKVFEALDAKVKKTFDALLGADSPVAKAKEADDALFQEDKEERRIAKLSDAIRAVKEGDPKLTGKALQDAIMDEFLSEGIPEGKEEIAEQWVKNNRKYRALTPKKVQYRGVDVRSLREPSEAVDETEAMKTLRDRIDATREKYETKAMQETIDEAMSVIEGYGDIETAFKALSKTSGLPAGVTEDVIQGARLIMLSHYSERLANNEGDTNAYESIDTLLDAIRKQSTDYGRAGNILRAWGMFQPTGLLHFMKGKQQKHNAVVAAQPSKVKGKNIGQVIDEMNKDLGGEIKDAVTVTMSGKAFENMVKRARPKRGAASIQKEREALREKYRNMPLMQTEGFTSNEMAMLIDFLDTYITKGGIRKLSEAKALLKEDLDAVGVALENFDEAFDIEFKNGVSYREYLGKLEAQKSIDKAIREVVKDHFDNPQSRRQTLAERLTWETGIDDADAKAIEKIVTAEFDKKLDEAAKKYMTRMWGSDKLPQDRKARSILDKLRSAIKAGAMTDEFFRNLFAAKFGFVEITEAQGKELVVLQGLIDEYKGTYWEADATRHLLRLMSGMYPQDAPNRFMETWTELIYASMLSGISTSVINVGTVGSNYLTKQVEDAFNFSKAIADIKQGKWNADMVTNLYGLGATFSRLSRGAKQYLDTMRKGGFGDKYTIEAVSNNRVRSSNVENMKPWKVFGREIPNMVAWAKYSGRNLFGQDKMTTAMFEDHYLMKLLIDYQAEITEKRGVALTKVVMNLYRNAFLDQTTLTDQIEQEAAAYTKKSGLEVSATQKKIRLYELQREKMFQDLLMETNVAKARDAREEANDLARTSVFTRDRGGVIASLAYAIGNGTAKLMEKNVGGKAAAMAIKVFIPFTKIVGNVAEYMLDYSPIYGFARANDFSFSGLSKRYLGKKTSAAMESERQHMEQMGRAYFGTITFLALGALLLGNDDEDDVWIVGSQGKDFKAERDVKNYSINFRRKDGKITSIPYMYMPALAIPLGLIGNLNDQLRMKETKDGRSIDMDTRAEELEEILNRFSIGMLATAGTNTAFIVKDMSFVEGGAKLLELSNQILTGQSLGTKSGVQYLTEEIIKRELGFMAKPLPQNTAMVQQAWKLFDPEQYSSKGTTNAIKYALGLQRINPQYSYDVLGHIKKTYPGENQLLNYPNWFNMKEQYPNVEFLDKYNALPKMPVNRATEIETADGIDYRKLEPKEWEQYTLRAGQLFDKMITEYSADAENVTARYAEKKVGRNEEVTTGVQEDVAKLWSKAKTMAGSEITEWGVVKSDTALWNRMVEHEATYPYSSSKTIDKERLNADELYRFNSIKAEEYAKMIKPYLMDSTPEQIAYDKNNLISSKKSTRWEYKLQKFKEKADDAAEKRYKREGRLGD